jgi:hypothetical protein
LLCLEALELSGWTSDAGDGGALVVKVHEGAVAGVGLPTPFQMAQGHAVLCPGLLVAQPLSQLLLCDVLH